MKLKPEQLAEIREWHNAGRKPKSKWITGSTIGEILDEAEITYERCNTLLDHIAALEGEKAELVGFIGEWGGIDGSHHKQWLLDQLLRLALKTTENYTEWVAEWEDGEDGAETYSWDTGIAP